jgi:hypothetical protein
MAWGKWMDFPVDFAPDKPRWVFLSVGKTPKNQKHGFEKYRSVYAVYVTLDESCPDSTLNSQLVLTHGTSWHPCRRVADVDMQMVPWVSTSKKNEAKQ